VTARVRTIEADEIGPWVACMGVGFLHPVADGYAEYFLGDVDRARSWGAFESDRVVGTLRSFPTAFTVPGPTEVQAAALTSVTVAPTHRRQGLLTAMITADLAASAARGEPLGILIASEYPIYGRFGYGAAVEGATYSADLDSVEFLRPDDGAVELVDLATMRKEAPAIYDRFRSAQPGSIERDERWWDRVLHQVQVPGAKPPEGYQAIYRAPGGEAEGYVRYRASEEWDSMRAKGLLTVEELLALTPGAYQRLWRYCCEVDLVTTLEAGNRSACEVLPWLLADGRAVRQTGRYDFVWVRILDVCAALGARRYAVEGGVVIEVVDALGFAAGRFSLEGGPDGATCTRTDASPDLSLGVGTLGSAYMGGVPLHVRAASGDVDVHRPGALARADAMFRSVPAPWCNTWF
jgi:predicted acetyltransferase